MFGVFFYGVEYRVSTRSSQYVSGGIGVLRNGYRVIWGVFPSLCSLKEFFFTRGERGFFNEGAYDLFRYVNETMNFRTTATTTMTG